MKPFESRRGKRRRGIAFLALVFLLLLIVIGAARTLIRGEIATRRSDADRIRVRTLTAAIEIAATYPTAKLTVPIDPSVQERIEVTRDDPQTQWIARWMRGQRQLDMITRQKSTQP